MAKLQFPSGAAASATEFQAMLHEMISTANPADDLLALTEELRVYEQRHNMSSAAFFAAYEQGNLSEPLAHEVAWAATYDMFLRLA